MTMLSTHPVQVIPVLDLLDGRVVRAVRGDRAAYQPIVSTLAAGSEPLTLARALLDRCARPQQESVLYVADLDAIRGRAAHVTTLARLLEQLPGLTLWLDAGFADAQQARALCARIGPAAARVRAVFGSESLRSTQALAELAGDASAVLSLDSKRATAIDPSGSWQRPDLWPRTVIVMTLDRVGAGSGPDLEMLQRLRGQAPDRVWVGAGGVRSAADLVAAGAAGASAWLVASALHDGQLDPRV
ncbi:MAG TPA: HisA/HisF-related TIM barrel protein [Burkholderiaceae bacterium]|nr:HisA/HisF-related TIM barrel protein [Burkholderiaceae bacterium]